MNLLNANKQNSCSTARSMNAKYFVIVAAMTVMLVGPTLLKQMVHSLERRNMRSQTAAQANSYGNDKLP